MFQEDGFFRWRGALHWPGQNRDPCRFLLRYTFYTEAPTKVGQINRERKNISRSCKNSKRSPINEHHNRSIDKEHTSKSFLKTNNVRDMGLAALMTLNHTFDRDSTSHQYPQTTTHQPRTDFYPLFSSLWPMNSKRKGLRVNFAFFPRNYIPGGQVNDTVASAKELDDLWKPGAMDGAPRPVMNCNCI